MFRSAICSLLFLSLAATSKGSTQHSEIMLLTVNKTSLSATLSTLPYRIENSQVIRSFRVAIGKAKGDKIKEGDNKTPEGIYFTSKHIDTTKINYKKYGAAAIPLDFPNPMDKRLGKTGYGIWLHGAGDDNRIANANVTEGCIAFYNSQILRLLSWLPGYGAVVAIAKDTSQINRPEDRLKVFNQTLNWVQSWDSRNLERYLSHYSDDFENKKRNIRNFKQYKKRLFAHYKKMDVDISLLRIVTHPKYAVSFMNQVFNGDDRFISKGRKILYWKKTAEGWRIIREFFDNHRFSPVQYTSDDVTKLASAKAFDDQPKKL